MVGVVKVYVLRRPGCDPSKCTGLKLARMGLAALIVRASEAPRRALVLNPFADHVLSPADREVVAKEGVLAVDGSWAEAQELFRPRLRGMHRRLPYLLAGNPVNYAEPYKLSTLEALAAALYIVGFRDEAERLLSIYKWGATFLSLNRELLDAYADAKDEEGVKRIEREVLEVMRR